MGSEPPGRTSGEIEVALPYGRAPLVVRVPADAVIVRTPVASVTPVSYADALARPVGAARLRGRVSAGAAVTIIVSDATRDEPRADLIRALLDEIGVPVKLTIAIANGTHGPGDVARLGIPSEILGRAAVQNHDAHDSSTFVDLGTTRRGTRVRFPPWLLESDLVLATGRIRPHYFAGFGAGAKAVFPGLGERSDIRQNHLLKRDPSARLGRCDGNACRDDLEEAARMLGVEVFLLNVVIDDGGRVSAVAGDVVAAHRAGCAVCRPLCESPAEPSDIVITSDGLPLAGSLYQASKLLAPAGPLVRPGGVAILAAECPDGTGPLDVVNQGIYELGIRQVFPDAHAIYLVSSLPASTVAQTYCRYAPSVESVLASHAGNVAVIPSAGNLIPRIVDVPRAPI